MTTLTLHRSSNTTASAVSISRSWLHPHARASAQNAGQNLRGEGLAALSEALAPTLEREPR